jgi:hypothetical protein
MKRRHLLGLLGVLLGLGLLEDVVLSTALLGLALVVLALVLVLGTLVAGQASHGAADGTGDTVANAAGVVVDLALGLLLLTLEVLLATSLLQALWKSTLVRLQSAPGVDL